MLLAVDSIYDFGTHVFVVKAQGVSRFVTNHAPKLGLGHTHRETLEIHRRLVFFDLKDFRAYIRPIARHVDRGFQSRYAHFAHTVRFAKPDICLAAPRVHVTQDARTQISLGVVEERHT